MVSIGQNRPEPGTRPLTLVPPSFFVPHVSSFLPRVSAALKPVADFKPWPRPDASRAAPTLPTARCARAVSESSKRTTPYLYVICYRYLKLFPAKPSRRKIIRAIRAGVANHAVRGPHRFARPAGAVETAGDFGLLP